VVNLIRYGSRLLPATERDRQALRAGGYHEAQITRVVPGSSIRKQHILSREDFTRHCQVLASAITMVLRSRSVISRGIRVKAAVRTFGRAFGPGLRHAIADYLYLRGDYGFDRDPPGGGMCSTFNDQTADNCDGCTFSCGTGGSEYGYGVNYCLLTNLFLNAPDAEFGHGDESAYDPEHTPGGPSVQRPKTPRTIERGAAKMNLQREKWPGDTVVDNDMGYWEPFGDEQGVKGPKYNQMPETRGPTLGVPIDPVDFKVDDDDNKKKEQTPGVYQPDRMGADKRHPEWLYHICDRCSGSGDISVPHPSGKQSAGSMECPKCGGRGMLMKDQADSGSAAEGPQDQPPDESLGEFDTHGPPSVGNVKPGTAIMGY
jgi:hypothetical protein